MDHATVGSWLAQHAVQAVIACGALAMPFILPMVQKWLVSAVISKLMEAAHVALSAGDQDDDVVVMAVVHWVEVKSRRLAVDGPARFKAVAEMVCSRVPVLKGREAAVEDLIVALVKAAEDAAKKVQDEQKPK